MMAFALYWILDPRNYNAKCPDVAQLAQTLGRTPNAVKMKLENLKSRDPNRIALGQKGLRNAAKLEADVWEAFLSEGEPYLERCLDMLCNQLAGCKISSDLEYALVEFGREGEERETLRMERVNQGYFRNSVLLNYQHRCCLSGLEESALLVASHIKPWAKCESKSERLAASNGLLLNALHDKAFDRGLITLDADYKVVVSSRLKGDDEGTRWIKAFEGKRIETPTIALPDKEFIEYHNDMVFVA